MASTPARRRRDTRSSAPPRPAGSHKPQPAVDGDPTPSAPCGRRPRHNARACSACRAWIATTVPSSSQCRASSMSSGAQASPTTWPGFPGPAGSGRARPDSRSAARRPAGRTCCRPARSVRAPAGTGRSMPGPQMAVGQVFDQREIMLAGQLGDGAAALRRHHPAHGQMRHGHAIERLDPPAAQCPLQLIGQAVAIEGDRFQIQAELAATSFQPG